MPAITKFVNRREVTSTLKCKSLATGEEFIGCSPLGVGKATGVTSSVLLPSTICGKAPGVDTMVGKVPGVGVVAVVEVVSLLVVELFSVCGITADSWSGTGYEGFEFSVSCVLTKIVCSVS